MKLLANLGLTLLLVLALGAVATAAVWTWYPELVHSKDAKWTGHHTWIVEKQLQELRTLSKTDRSAAISGLEALTDELRVSLKADRRYPIRRQALQLLADLRFDTDDVDGARRIGEEILENYENDVGGRLWLGRRLCAHEKTRARGLEIFEDLFARLPELGVIARAYHDSALAAGDGALAANVLVRHLDRALRPEQSLEGITGIWQVWWSQDGSWANERRVDVKALRYGEVTAIGFEIPEAASLLRLDPPVRSHLAYSTPRFGIFEGELPVEIPIPVDELKTNGLHLDLESMIVEGDADPWVVLPLPEAHRSKPLRGRFVFQADRLPLWIGEAASSPALRAATAALPTDSRAKASLLRARDQYAAHQAAR